MSISADQITIAITVYDRREFLFQAIESALDQTVPVRVMVVEDCGPDAGLQAWVKSRFGERIEYYRSPLRRGLFGNWNACMEVCGTPWLSILHDDDYLAPTFIEAMLALAGQSPDCALLFGRTRVVDEAGRPHPEWADSPLSTAWRQIRLEDALYTTPLLFPGQLFRTAAARDVGGFRESSWFCGDWEMWAKLIACCGAAQTNAVVAFNRHHSDWQRGTNKVIRSGRLHPLTVVQHKRVLHRLRQTGKAAVFDRRDFQRRSPMSSRYLLRYGHGLSPRRLNYHVGLLLLSHAPHWRYRLFQWLVQWLGAGFVRSASRGWMRARKETSSQRP